MLLLFHPDLIFDQRRRRLKPPFCRLNPRTPASKNHTTARRCMEISSTCVPEISFNTICCLLFNCVIIHPSGTSCVCFRRSPLVGRVLLIQDSDSSASISAQGPSDGFKISIIIITVFIKEPYTLEWRCRKWSLTVCMQLQRDGSPFVWDGGRQRMVRKETQRREQRAIM